MHTCDPALQDYAQAHFGDGVKLYYNEFTEPDIYEPPGVSYVNSLFANLWVLDDGFGICGYGETPEEAIHNAVDWLEEDMPTQKPKNSKSRRTYWVETSRTTAVIMCEHGKVVYTSAQAWKRICMGRPFPEALEALESAEGKAEIRHVVRYFYLPLPEEE